ncbi:MAG: MBL fold metallo-hydrolase [FCB group bacterium]|jgi:glyoxylase-like metal-dependent hydrolase (beta-lactamase superfamily II)|nr:MBL fold metallo-hydrolase [FCB group bacterium]
MIFRHFLLKVNEANAFILACNDTREAILIDAGDLDNAIPVFLAEHNLTLSKVFITHDHYDHTDGLPAVVQQYRAEVFSGKDAIANIATRRVRENAEIQVGNLVGRVIATPGHTPEGMSLAFPGMVFTGDALFAGSVGGTPGARQARQQIDHITKGIFSLPPETEIHCGHGPSTTVAIESRHNPFFV